MQALCGLCRYYEHYVDIMCKSKPKSNNINPNKQIYQMTENSSNLLGFLKKKSLFNNSPTKQLKRKEKSKDSKDFNQRSYNKEPLEQDIDEPASMRLIHKNSERNLVRREVDSAPKETKVDPQSAKRINRFEQMPGKNPEENMKANNLWTGLVNYSTSFESARIESAQCLETLSIKIHNEVSSINYKIDMFNSKMSKILTSEFKTLKERIYSIVEEVFKESERSMKEYMKQQEKILASDLLNMKDTLEKQFLRIEAMKEEINKPSWRKVAGELLSSQLEQKVEQQIKLSSAIDIGHWELSNLGANKIKSLEMEIKEIVKLNKANT